MGLIVAYTVSHSHPIRVLLDGTAIPADLAGVGRYVDHHVPELLALGGRAWRGSRRDCPS